jgi:CCR4-NOT transcriptional regulation complex NOT5 subunit
VSLLKELKELMKREPIETIQRRIDEAQAQLKSPKTDTNTRKLANHIWKLAKAELAARKNGE